MSEHVKTGSGLIVFCGKGGTGKTALSAIAAKILMRRNESSKLLLIDADPAMGLMNAVGVKIKHTMGEIREKVIKMAEKGTAKEKNRLSETFDYLVLDALVETDRFAFLAMGRTETLGCFCPVNSLLREAIESLSRNFNTIIIDGEAGVEQINRQVVHNVESLVVISDATTRGLQTAALVKEMVQNEKVIHCEKIGLVFNRVDGNVELLKSAAKDIGMEVFGIIPQDHEIAAYDLIGRPLVDLPDASPACRAVEDMLERCFRITDESDKK